MLNKATSRTSFLHCTAVALGCATFFAIIGCGGDTALPGRDRVSASGKVLFDGKPVPAGGVSFLHKASGNTGYCPITNGEYEEEDGQGPVVGENTMTVVGLEMVDGNPLWGGNYSKEVVIGKDGFKEDMTIMAADVQPADKNYINVDDE